MRYSIIGASAEQVQNAGGQDIKEAKSAKIIFAELTEVQARQLMLQGCRVSRVGGIRMAVMPPLPIAAIPTYTPQELLWALGIDEVRSLTVPPLYGAGINVAVIDTGIRETHEQVSGHVIYRKNFTTDSGDGFNHGTGVASIILSVAPEAGILDLKILDKIGNGTEEDVALAIDEAISLHDAGSEFAPQMLNLSLGGPDDGNPDNPMRVACRAAIERGIWVIAAAGNDGPNPGTVMSPACERYVGAVGSVRYLPDEESFVISDFSSRGPTVEGLVKPDAVLFGEGIIMASHESDTATVSKSGTSFATPFVSGMVAVFLEGMARRAQATQEIPGIYPELEIYDFTPADIIDTYLVGFSIKPLGAPPGKDNDYGCGLPFGPLVARLMAVRPTAGFQALVSMVAPVMTLGMLGMMMSAMTKGATS